MADFYEQYMAQRATEGLYEKAIGTILPKANLSTNLDFEHVMRQLYLMSDDGIYAKLQEVLRNPPLDAWVIEVRFVIEWGHFNSSVQAFPRRRVADAMAGTPYRDAYKKIIRPVPSEHIRVVTVMPIKDCFWIVDRPIEWRAPRDENDQIMLEEPPLIVAPDASLVAKYAGATSESTPREEPPAATSSEPAVSANAEAVSSVETPVEPPQTLPAAAETPSQG